MVKPDQSSAPTVTVVTPSYNAAAFIAETIRSVQRQTFADFEHLIVDDGSNDDTRQIVANFSRDDPRVRLICQPSNKGPAAARNRAIEEARGRYIAFLDGDDFWHPQKLDRQLKFMGANDVAFCYTYYYKVDSASSIVGAVDAIPDRVDYRSLLTRCPIGCLTAVYDTRRCGKVLMPNVPRGQDYGLWLKLLRQGISAELLPLHLAYYRVGLPNSVSSQKLRKAVSLWHLYRRYEKMGLVAASYYLARFSINALRK